MTQHQRTEQENPATLRRASLELEKLRLHDEDGGVCSVAGGGGCNDVGAPFPAGCRKLLRSLPGNNKCVDCGNRNPDWASVTYGVLLCVNCSGRHRSYGVATSRVRSVSMDTWSHSQVLAMLEGGNEQLDNFYRRHDMGESNSAVFERRYQTKAARFYRKNMEEHVKTIRRLGQWKGRAASRKPAGAATAKSRSSSRNNNNNNHHHHHHRHCKPVAMAAAAG